MELLLTRHSTLRPHAWSMIFRLLQPKALISSTLEPRTKSVTPINSSTIMTATAATTTYIDNNDNGNNSACVTCPGRTLAMLPTASTSPTINFLPPTANDVADPNRVRCNRCEGTRTSSTCSACAIHLQSRSISRRGWTI